MTVRATPGQRAPTLHDVARAAGVSHQTVSRVINDGPNVSPAMRARVLEALEATRYRRNSSAKALRTSTTGNIGVLLPVNGGAGLQAIVQSIETAARERGYAVLVSSADLDSSASLRQGIARALSQPVDGIIAVLAHQRFNDLPEAHAIPIPHVEILSESLGERTPAGARPGELGARIVTRHLIDLGHKHIVHVPGPPVWISAQVRLNGFTAEMRDHSLDPVVSEPGDWSAESGFRIGQELLRTRPDTTAVFTANDEMAIGLLHAARLAGIAVPADLSVVGYDDLPSSQYLAPPLTTLRKDESGLGTEAVELLVARITGKLDPAPGLTRPFEPTLVMRESTARPRLQPRREHTVSGK